MPGPVFIEGEDVSLRTIEEEDVDFLHEQVNDARIWRPIDRSTPLNRVQERGFFDDVICDDGTVHLLIVADGSPVGTLGFAPLDRETGTAELGYWVTPAHQRQGYGTEAVELFVAYGFDQLGLHRISARVMAFNEPSVRLLERVGFVREGTSREAVFVDGERHDAHWYGLLATEWRRENERSSVG